MNNENDRSEYLKNYKKHHYNRTRKVITFPLLNEDYEKMKVQADKTGLRVNKMVKEMVLNHLENKANTFQSKEHLETLKEYMRISRGIATNINQMAHSSNIGQTIDVSILINSLKNYEDEFKKLLAKIM